LGLGFSRRAGLLNGAATTEAAPYLVKFRVSSRNERIEAAKADWKACHFDPVPAETAESIALPT